MNITVINERIARDMREMSANTHHHRNISMNIVHTVQKSNSDP